MNSRIAVVNSGSSSIKFAVYEGGASALLFRGQIEQIGVSPRLHVTDAAGAVTEQREYSAKLDHRLATQEILQATVRLLDGAPVAGVGHRVVHGGTGYAAPIRVNADVMTVLAGLIPLAPLHQPHNLAAIDAITEAAPSLPQVACFDTAFHRNQPALAQLFALPRKFTELGIRRYGFHGLSYEFITSRLGDVASEHLGSRIVAAHLGNGASCCAIENGRSIATTMGFTALEGLVMGTRCGSIDPGVLLYLMTSCKMDVMAVEDLLYRKSGLLGVSGISSDMRELRASSDPAAIEAISLFVYRVIREIGSMTAALGGIDALIFTGGIGENDAATRAEIAKGCHWLGVRLDETRNARGQGLVSTDDSNVAVVVVRTDEEQMIAQHTSRVLGLDPVPVQ